jgi:hypothetical protein
MTLFLLLICLSMNVPDLLSSVPGVSMLSALPSLNADEIIGIALAALVLDFMERRRGRRRMVDEVLKHIPPAWQKRADATSEKSKENGDGKAD